MPSPTSLPPPSVLAEQSASEADRLLGELERTVPRRPGLVRLAPGAAPVAWVFGDSHGDWRSTEQAVDRFLRAPDGSLLIGLGDYIDRAPRDCPGGSVANALFLLSATARWPDRVYLLTGNHELARTLGASPHTLPQELEELYGPNAERYARLMGLLERGPLALVAPSGAYLAHAGFPQHPSLPRWEAPVELRERGAQLEVTWAECAASRNRRGAASPWGIAELDGFLAAAGLTVVLRGHDPDLTGRAVYGDRVLTLHTCRLYGRYGGVLVGRLPLDRRVLSVKEIELEHLNGVT